MMEKSSRHLCLEIYECGVVFTLPINKIDRSSPHQEMQTLGETTKSSDCVGAS